jgi:hypothetical protein
MSTNSVKIELDKLMEAMAICRAQLDAEGMAYDTGDLIAMASAVVANEIRRVTGGVLEEMLSAIASGVSRR